MKKQKSIIPAVFSIAGLLLLWKILNIAIAKEIILPSPESVFVGTVSMFRQFSFWKVVAATVLRGLVGFVGAFLLGLTAGIPAGRSRVLTQLLKPLLLVTQTVPVVAIILLILIWTSSNFTPVIVTLLMVFPIITTNVLEGMRSIEPNYLKMAQVYRLKETQIIRKIYIPAILPYIIAASRTSLSVTWKVVIAAEVLALPSLAVGTGLYDAKILLETSEMFSWTLVAILLSGVSNLLFSFFVGKYDWRKPK